MILLIQAAVFTGSPYGFAQQDSLNSILRKFDRYRNQTLGEKLYVHTDRTFYLTGETMWFNVYYFDASMHRPLDVSKVAYLEILDLDNKAVLQTKISMNAGGGNGTFFFPTSLPSGNYSLRAYTHWMRNFSPDLYFMQSITIVNPFAKAGLVPRAKKPEYDVQFFPEGGHLVNGLKSTVGFRVVDESGKGVEFRGAILDDRNDTIIHFRPLKFGIGNFSFTPSNRQYRALIRDAKGNTYAAQIPAVESQGYVLHVQDSDSNRLLITVSGQGQKQLFYFLAHTRQVVTVAEGHFLENGQTNFYIDKNKLGEGITHFTVFSQEMEPVCERLYFKHPHHKVAVEIHSDQSNYSQRQKINLTLLAHDREGKAEELELSLSVAKADTLQGSNPGDIVSYVWLTSELKGNIESPAYYFSDDSARAKATDNLMLTHGWTRFRWTDILKNNANPFDFIPEYHGHIIHGRLLDIATGIPVKRKITYLSTPGKNVRWYVSRSDEQGIVRYELQDFIGARKIVAQTNYLLDSSYRIEITNPFSEVFPSTRPERFELAENQRDPITARSFQMQIQNAFYDENPNRIDIPDIDSSAFYGIADERYWLDDYTRFPTMEEVMREYVPGILVRKRKGKYHFMTIDHPNRSMFRDDPMVLLDGVPVFDIDKIIEFDPRKIQKLDVITQQYFLGPISFDGLVSYTTYLGDLSDFQLNANALITIYEGLQWTREFFIPRYESPDSQRMRIPDMRNLLYWSPRARTGSNGKKEISFYSSDVPGRYTVVAQGISSNGIPVVSTYSFTVTDRDKF